MDQFARIKLYYSPQQFERIQKSHVCVCGLGGVGGICAETLVRCGVTNITMIDFDRVDVTNINRQIIATHESVGQLKTEVMKERLLTINPNAQITIISQFIDEGLLQSLDHFDYLIDAIDTVTAKLAIYRWCQQHSIPFISSCGMGNRQDPSQLKVTTIEKTINDPLAKILRLECKKQNIKKVKVVYSLELPKKQHQAVDTSEIRKEKFPPSSLSFVVNSAGLLLSAECIKELVGEH